MSTSSNKTKEWLKNQLVTHGVPLPAATAKKTEYQKLYDEQVLPQQGSGEFSSDDDTEPTPQLTQQRAPSVAKSSNSESKKENNGDIEFDKHAAWIHQMSDQNLFDALSANGRSPGPIVDSTREFYRKMLLDLLHEDEKNVLEKIDEYLSGNPEARDLWEGNGLNVHAFNGVSNGNTENGFSDTDEEDDGTETASRASRSSRASSKRNTPSPVKSPPGAFKTTPLSPFENKSLRTRTSASVRHGLALNDPTVDYNEPEMSASTSARAETLMFSRVINSSGRLPYRPYKPLLSEHADEVDQPSTVVQKPSWRNPKRLCLSLLIFIVFIVVPVLGAIYYFSQQKMENSCQEGVDCPDELDILLESLNNQANDGVQAGIEN